MTAEELAEVVRLHGAWSRRDSGGVKADLRGANLCWANLCWANLSEADLRGADLTGAKVLGADLTGAKLDGVIFPVEHPTDLDF